MMGALLDKIFAFKNGKDIFCIMAVITVLIFGSLFLFPTNVSALTAEDCEKVSGTLDKNDQNEDICVDSDGKKILTYATKDTGPKSTTIGDCSWDNFTFDACLLVPGVTYGTIGMLSLGGSFASMAGALFDTLVTHTIIQFGTELEDLGAADAIKDVWSAFRDLANIVIVGMFVFIAIATILGIEQYGVQKMISRVLIVALLINFSLFFTQFIIDVSHFTAAQFYKGISGDGTSQQHTISDAYVEQIAGVYTTKDVESSLRAGEAEIWKTLFGGVMGMFLLMAVAAVFFYGTYLLAIRAVMLLLLMITSSLAFASYLIPSAANSSYGWSKWWGALLHSAVMAPMLMIMLWATLQLISAQKEIGIKAFLENPGNASYAGAVISFIFSIGMLYASFKVSSSIAGKVQGWSIAAKVPALGLRATSGVLGAGGRTLVGGGALGMSRVFNNWAKSLEKAGFSRTSGAVYRAQRSMDNLSKRDFNFMNTNLGKGVAKEAGLTGVLAGTTTLKGAHGIQEQRAKYAKERAEAVSPDKEDQEKIKEAVRAEYYNRPENTDKKTTVDEANTNKTQAEREKGELTTAYAEKIREYQREAAAARDAGDALKLSYIEHNQDVARQQHQTALKEVEKRIAEAEKITKQHDKEIDEQIAKGDNMVTRTDTENIARRVATQRLSRAYGFFGADPTTDPVSNAAAGKIKKSKGNDSVLKAIKDQMDKGDDKKGGDGEKKDGGDDKK